MQCFIEISDCLSYYVGTGNLMHQTKDNQSCQSKYKHILDYNILVDFSIGCNLTSHVSWGDINTVRYLQYQSNSVVYVLMCKLI